MKIAFRIAMLVTLSLALVGAANAGTITYTETAIASGNLGTNNFTDALVTLTMTGATTNVTNPGSNFFQNLGTLNLTVAGVGSGTFNAGSYGVFVNQVFSPPAAGGFQFSPNSSILDTLNATFATYDLMTSIGPITGASFIRPDITYSTTAGAFNLQSAGNSTFTASTPEPGSLLLFGSGLCVAGIIRRKLRK